MINLDILQQKRAAITQSLSDAIAKNDEAAVQHHLLDRLDLRIIPHPV